MADFSSTEDITSELASFIQKAENLTSLRHQEKKIATTKQKDFFSLHQILNTTFEATPSEEKVKNENIINQDIVNMVSGVDAYNNQIIDMNEVNRISWFCPKIDVERDVFEETPTCITDVENEETLEEEEYPESKTSSDKDEESGYDKNYEETKEASDCLAFEEVLSEHLTTGESSNPSSGNEETNVKNEDKINLNTRPEKLKVSSSEMINMIDNNRNLFQTLPEVITEEQEISVAPRKEKLSLFKRIFRRKRVM